MRLRDTMIMFSYFTTRIIVATTVMIRLYLVMLDFAVIITPIAFYFSACDFLIQFLQNTVVT